MFIFPCNKFISILSFVALPEFEIRSEIARDDLLGTVKALQRDLRSLYLCLFVHLHLRKKNLRRPFAKTQGHLEKEQMGKLLEMPQIRVVLLRFYLRRFSATQV